jgi:hypothetical protein
VDFLHTLKLSEIVVFTESLLDGLVRVLLRWVGPGRSRTVRRHSLGKALTRILV